MMSQAIYSQSVPGQDVSSFYVVTGFHNPLLRSGQYMVSLAPHYYHSEYNYYSTTQSLSNQTQPPNTSESSGRSSGKSSYYDFSFASLYGLSSDITLNLTLTYFPKQNANTQQSSSLYSYQSSSSSSSGSNLNDSSEDNDNINSSITISYRPERNVELAFQARYSSSNSIGIATGSSISNYGSLSTDTYNSSNTGKFPSYDFSFAIVLLSN
jgi:hypothetical protein